MSEFTNTRRGIQKSARWFMTVHRRLIRPPYPVRIYCPACGHPFCEINAELMEISNHFGLPPEELKAPDAWSQHKHTCGAKITLYWKS